MLFAPRSRHDLPVFDAADYDRKRVAEARRKAASALSEKERAGYLELAEIFEERAAEVCRSRERASHPAAPDRGQGAADRAGGHLIVYAAAPHAEERMVECSCGWKATSSDPLSRDHASDMQLLTDRWLEYVRGREAGRP